MIIALAQINPTVGDLEGNAQKITSQIEAARGHGADLIVFPELTTFGYPAKDLVFRADLVRENVAQLEKIALTCRGITAVVGFVEPDATKEGKGIFNAAAVCSDGLVKSVYRKRLLPTYDVFDESRNFNAGGEVLVTQVGGESGAMVGVTICEDLWHDQQYGGRRVYGIDPVRESVDGGAKIIINLSASPFRTDLAKRRDEIFQAQAREHGVYIVYVNQVGGNDDLVFEGASGVYGPDGSTLARAKTFQEDLLLFSVDGSKTSRLETYPSRMESIRSALVLGVRDYARKCGFREVVLGLSGGIDSALTAAIAAEALGAEHVYGVALPSRYSSDHSVEDAKQLAENLGMKLDIVPIEPVHAAMERAVETLFDGRGKDVTEENIQARIRGNILMALSNKFGRLLLTTGNKSELAVGYCTLYGDMCGGLAVISDVPKMMVYELARHINEDAGREVIPLRTIEKPPSAELRDAQFDQDSLPPYDMLDAILQLYVERDYCVDEIVEAGFDREIAMQVTGLVIRSEHKRKQSPVGIKVTSRAFGSGRRMPIAAKYQ